MATPPDPLFLQSHEWFRQALTRVLDAAGFPLPADRARAEAALWRLLGRRDVAAPLPAPNALTLEMFDGGGAQARSLALATLVVTEFLNALETVEVAVAAARAVVDGGLDGASRQALFGVVARVVRQVRSIVDGADPAQRHPAAFALARLMLVMSGDARTPPPPGSPPAQRLATAVARGVAGGAPTPVQVEDAADALALTCALAGAVLDRSFGGPADAGTGWQPGALAGAVPASALGPLALRFGAPAGPARIALRLVEDAGAAGAAFDAALELGAAADGEAARLQLRASAGLKVWQPLLPPGPARAEGAAPQLSLRLAKATPGGQALRLGPVALGGFGTAELRVREIAAALTVAARRDGLAPALEVSLVGGQVRLAITEALLRQVLAGDVTLDFDVQAQLDAGGRLHLKDGSGLRVTLPLPQLPTPALDLQLLHLGIEPLQGAFAEIDAELSASFGLSLGPFKGALDRIGVVLRLRGLDGGTPSVAFAFKPPTGLGLALDAGVVKGGGYVALDAESGEYAGVLELKLLAIGVKAIAILNTRVPDAGWSLLLLIFGNFPPIQLSFGFTLTGLGGLIGLQHTLSTDKLSQGLASGALDAVLFPANPVADAPQIINTLRGLFPTRKGGFVIGPMLEVGWGTPNLVTLRMGVLIEPTQIVVVGQALIQIPPLVAAELAILRLQVDFVGFVKFDPFKLGFDGVLRDSRVLFITLTGSLAFRASFGARPSFLLSAGGFHPRFRDVPEDVPAMQRIGAGFSIGIVGVSFQGYFAVTSATVQAGSELRIWADVGIASFDGGFGWDIIVYLEPQFHFEADMRVWVKLQILGFSVGARIEGTLEGPGRWRAAGQATVDLGFFGEHSVDFDERWGTAVATPLPTEDVAAELARLIGLDECWSAQLPRPEDACVTLARAEGATVLMAHPRAPLTFRQKYVPLGVALQRLGTKRPLGANRFETPVLSLAAGAAPATALPAVPVQDHFAAAQFFEVREADRLQGPSFERFDAGASAQMDGYAAGPAVAEDYDFEEVNLSRDEVPKRIAVLHLGALAQPAWALAFGAAARSVQRERARLLPPAPPRARVAEPGYAVTRRASADALASSAGGGSYREAVAAVAAAGAAGARRLQVSERFEALV